MLSGKDGTNTVTRKNATVTKRKNATAAVVMKGNASPSTSPQHSVSDNKGGKFSPFVRTSNYSVRKRYKKRSSSLSLSKYAVADLSFVDKIMYYWDRIVLWIHNKVPRGVQYAGFVLAVWMLCYTVYRRRTSVLHKTNNNAILPETASILLERQQQSDHYLQLRRNGSSTATTTSIGRRKMKEIDDEDMATIALLKFKTRHIHGMHYPRERVYRSNAHDYGGLEFSSSDDENDDGEHEPFLMDGGEPMPRIIHDDPWLMENDEYRDPRDLLDDDFEPDYVPQEDDYIRYYKEHDDIPKEEPDEGPHSDHLDRKYHPMTDGEIGCRRMAWQKLRLLNCNNFHEQNLRDLNMRYLGHGDFRQAAAVSVPYGNTRETLVYKHIIYHSELKEEENADFDYQDIEFMRLDSLIAERMTVSPRIFDMYGLCGIASYSEFALHGTIEDEIYGETVHEHEEYDYEKHGNELSSVEKAEYCLQMALSVADLHGHKDGLIIHEDLKADQFLWNEDQSAIKLNDFSRSVIVMWNDNTQEYCEQDENEEREWRTPEEFHWSHHITDKTDIHNLASVFYVVLLGQSKQDVMEVEEEDYLLEGNRVIIDKGAIQHFTAAEKQLAEIIDACQVDEQAKRPDIFQLVKMLEATVTMAKQEEKKEADKKR